MSRGSVFSWRKEIDAIFRHEWVVIEYLGEAAGEHLEAWISPARGSNLSRLSVDGQNVIDFDPNYLVSSWTGTPVLYPTPNRVRDCVFHYRGKDFPQTKHGKQVFNHGLVYDEPWQAGEPQITAEAISLVTWIDFDPANACFTAFPFRHRLSLEFRLNPGGLRVTYSIENRDDQAIPFGFGLHPHFSKHSSAEGARVELPSAYVMEATTDLLPTGRLLPVKGTGFDLHHPVNVNELDMDHVFTGISEGQAARVSYPDLRLTVRLAATPDFSHLVLYTPPGAPFFCLENQTCSTDAHNLHDIGFKMESGLKFVPPGENRTGAVTYEIVRERA